MAKQKAVRDALHSSEEWQNLFANKDEEFAGFEQTGTVLAPKMAPLGAKKLTKANDQFVVSLFILIYSLPYPTLFFLYFLIFLYCFCACKLQEAHGVILVNSAPQICSFQDGGVFIKRSFEALRCSFGLLNLLSKGYLNA